MGHGEHAIGLVIKDTYRIERLIGEGGMGAVYEASHLRLERRFAVKLLFPAFAEHPDVLARFQREARVTSGLGHPNILEVIDFDTTADGEPFIVMELLEGESLAARLHRVRQLELSQAVSIVRETTSALEAAHDKMIVHRDLKPHNIFLCRRRRRDDFVKVVDFGVSKMLGAATAITRAHALIGTPNYMSPEQAEQRSEEVDLRTDVYAMGVIIFEMLTGEAPFSAGSIPQLLFKIAYRPAPPLRTLRPDLPEALEQVLLQAMAKDPAARFASMGELWEAFRLALGLPDLDEDDRIDDSVQRVLRTSGQPQVRPASQPQARPADPAAGRTGPPPGAPVRSAPVSPSLPGAAGSTTLSASLGEVVPAPRRKGLALIVAAVAAFVGVSTLTAILALRAGDKRPAAGSGSGLAVQSPRPDTRAARVDGAPATPTVRVDSAVPTPAPDRSRVTRPDARVTRPDAAPVIAVKQPKPTPKVVRPKTKKIPKKQQQKKIDDAPAPW
jgi:eukaryotic-like serine/threonine-protein kinase